MDCILATTTTDEVDIRIILSKVDSWKATSDFTIVNVNGEYYHIAVGFYDFTQIMAKYHHSNVITVKSE